MFQNMLANLAVLLNPRVTTRQCEKMHEKNTNITKTEGTRYLYMKLVRLENTPKPDQRTKRKN